MSEYQFIDFVAVDRPVSKKNLSFMHEQSTRADISEWRFTNEYHYGGFHGDEAEMLRRGYDAHLHYANFGIRKIMFRLPNGLPFDKQTLANYAPEEGLTWDQDKRGPGGILTISPEADAGTYEDEPDLDSLLDSLVPLRETLINGDLRPLFLAWLASCYDDDADVPPIPAGLDKLTRPLAALAEFYEIPKSLIRRAARHAPPAPTAVDQGGLVKRWIARKNKTDLQEILWQLLTTDPTAVRSDVMADIRASQPHSAWPTTNLKLTYGELRQQAPA